MVFLMVLMVKRCLGWKKVWTWKTAVAVNFHRLETAKTSNPVDLGEVFFSWILPHLGRGMSHGNSWRIPWRNFYGKKLRCSKTELLPMLH